MTTTTLISFILFSVFSFPVVRSTTSIGQEWPCSFSFSTVFTFLIVTTSASIIQGWPSCFHVFTCMVLASWCFYKRWISMDFTSFYSTEDIKVASSAFVRDDRHILIISILMRFLWGRITNFLIMFFLIHQLFLTLFSRPFLEHLLCEKFIFFP